MYITFETEINDERTIKLMNILITTRAITDYYPLSSFFPAR